MNKKLEKRIRLKKKIRTKILGTSKRPRLSVFRSNQYIYAQVIDDIKHTTIISASDLPKKDKKMTSADAKNTKKSRSIDRRSTTASGKKVLSGKKTERAMLIGTEIAKALNAKGIKKVVFDRNGFKYTGRVKALADSARASGLEF